jgi:general secretion pathway protein H
MSATQHGRSALGRGARTAYRAGFTLVEILVVIIIAGVIVSAATLSIGVLGRDQQAEEETRRVWALLRQASEEAELQSLDLALFVSTNQFEFLRFDARRNEWLVIGDDRLYAARELPEGLRFRLWLEGREIVLKSGLPNRSDIDVHRKWPPQILVLSSGEVIPFELQVERDARPALWRVVALADNDLQVNRRDERSNWVVIARTRPADEDRKERLSDARR